MPKRFNSSRIRTLVQVVLAGYLMILLISTHLPPSSPLLPNLPNNTDKLCHFTAYATLAVLLASTWQLSAGERKARHLFLIWVVVAVFGALDEITQPPFHRDCDFWDWTADAIGAATGLLIFVWLREKIAAQFSKGKE